MHIRPCFTTDAWELLASGWNRLTRGNPFCSWEWLSSWWRCYGIGHELCVLAVYDSCGTLVGAAPWYLEFRGTWGRVLRMIGSGEVCSEYLTLVCTPEFEQPVADAVANWLTQPPRNNAADRFAWDLLSLDCVAANDAVTGKLVTNLSEAGCSVVRTAGPSCWSIQLPANWDDYLSLLSRSHRKQMQRAIREYCDTGRAKLSMAQNEEELAMGMQVLEELHGRRWASRGKSGVFGSERFAEFLQTVAPRLLRAGALELSVLSLDGSPAAVDFHLVNQRANFVYQGGIHPALAEHSPGSLLTGLLIRDAIERGRERFDFLRGDERYKAHFRATRTSTSEIHVVARRAGSQLRHGLWLAGLTVKNLVKSGMSLTGMH